MMRTSSSSDNTQGDMREPETFAEAVDNLAKAWDELIAEILKTLKEIFR